MKIGIFYHHVKEAAKQQNCDIIDILRKMKAVGVSGIELDRDDIDNPEELSQMLKEEGFQISNIYGFYDFNKQDDTERCHKHLGLAQQMGAKRIMIVPGFFTGDESSRQQEFEQMIEGTKRLCIQAEALGIQPTIEDFDALDSPLCSLAGVKEFLERIPELGMTLDTGNFILVKDDEVKACLELKNRIVHIHCKDRKTNPQQEILPSAVGQGYIKMKEVLDIIGADYNGYYVIEHYGSDDFLKDMLDSVQYLSVKSNSKSSKYED